MGSGVVAVICAGLTSGQEHARREFAGFADENIRPHADAWDTAATMPEAALATVAERGYLGAVVPRDYGGSDLDAITFGLLNEQLGRACSSMRSLLTVHSMVAHAIARWGSAAQRAHWLPELAAGRTIGAFALTEPDAGSDVQAIRTGAQRVDGGFLLNGRKHWITFGARAGLFLVFARLADAPAAFLVPRGLPGLDVVPKSGALGTRASMLADLWLRDCPLPAEALLGRPGFGLNAVGADALELGRYSVAWGCVGLADACVSASLDYAGGRRQFGRPLREHQLVQRMLADMVTNTGAARLLCQQAGWLRQSGDPRCIAATWQAKYFAAGAAMRAASDAVQIHGANGIGDGYPVQRYLRDAKVMEIIEGSTELQQITIAQAAYQQHRRDG